MSDKAASRHRKIQALRNISLFDAGDLSDEALWRLADICREEKFAKGERIFAEGEIGAKLFFILEGAVRISLKMEQQGEETLAVFHKGDFFGEMALISSTLRSANAHAHRDCRLLSISREELKKTLAGNAALANAVLWGFCNNLSRRLRITNKSMKSLLELARMS